MSELMSKLMAAYAEVNENQKAAAAKQLAKAAASTEKGKAAVTLSKAPWDKQQNEMSSKEKMKKGLYNSNMDPVGQADADIDNDGDVDKSDKYLHKRRKAIKKNMNKEGEIVMNPKTTGSQSGAMPESTTWPVYARILENREAHYKGATPPQDADDGLSPNAKKLKRDQMAGKQVDDTEEKGHDDASKAARITKPAATRNGDNKAGDKAIINKPEDVTQKGGMKG